jgi:type IX secretion system PorP/SprF family membrane protein
VRVVGIYIALLLSLGAAAQDIPVSQYMHHGLPLNPAFAGSLGALSTSLTNRQQWTGFDAAPTTNVFSIHSPVVKEKIGVGALVTNETIGVTRSMTANVIASYNVKVATGKLFFGIKGGVEQLQNNWLEVQTNEEGDVLFSNNDRFMTPQFGAGLYYMSNIFYASLSTPSLLTKEFRNGDYEARLRLHQTKAYFTSGLDLQMSKDFTMRPSMLLSANGSGYFRLDLNLLLCYKKRVELGLSTRSSETYVGMLRFWVVPQMSLAYSYDMERLSLRGYTRGSHEITLRFDMIFNRPVANPRFF